MPILNTVLLFVIVLLGWAAIRWLGPDLNGKSASVPFAVSLLGLLFASFFLKGEQSFYTKVVFGAIMAAEYFLPKAKALFAKIKIKLHEEQRSRKKGS